MSQAPSSPSSAASYPTSGVSYLTPTPPKAKSESPAAQTPDLEAHSALSASTAPPSSLGHTQTQAQTQIQTQTQAAPTPSSPNRAGPRLLSSSPSGSIAASNASVTEQLERLTDAILKVGDGLEQCKRASERRAAAEDERYAAKAGEGGTSMQAQLARMMAMQREVRERGREPIKGSATFAQDLQRAAFGAGGSPQTVSRASSMLEARSDSLSMRSSTSSRSKQ